MHNVRFLKVGACDAEYDGTLISSIVAEVGTPAYIYSATGIKDTIREFVEETNVGDIRYKYAVKANTNIEIIRLIHKHGFGADVVSIGEVYAALKAGVSPQDIVFAGMGKTPNELKSALDLHVGYISVESEWEYHKLQEFCAGDNYYTRLLIRTNLNVDGSTHPYLTTGREENKFGIDSETVASNFTVWQSSSLLPIDGIQVHIGSQILDVAAFEEAAKTTIDFVERIRKSGAVVKIVDFGGGVGVSYDGNEKISLKDYGGVIRSLHRALSVTVFLEPGRFLIAGNGIVCGSVIYHKEGVTKDFLVTDIGMNDLIRPALYEAFHEIIPIHKGTRQDCNKLVDIVGPICESGDFVGLKRRFPMLAPGDYVLVNTAGAYGFTMTSNYNLRPKPPEVLVDRGIIKIIRPRQELDEYI